MTAQADDEGLFVVRYTGAKIGYLLRRAVPAYLFFVALIAVYINDGTRQMLSNGRDEPPSALGLLILGTFVAAAFLDVILTIATFRRGNPALVIRKDGVEGPVIYRKRRFAWDDIAGVFERGGDVLIERKPKNWLETFSVRHAPPGSRHRWTALMRTPLACVDRSAAEVSAALREFGPPDLAQTERCKLD